MESIVCLIAFEFTHYWVSYLIHAENIVVLIMSNFSLTNFNLTISVLSLFLMLVKAPMFILNVFYPPLSVLVHIGLTIIYAISIAYQASPDMSDPERPQPGAPWYLTKNCNVAKSRSNVGYCRQAKASFACTVLMLYVTGHSLSLLS